MIQKKLIALIISVSVALFTHGEISKVWVADLGNGMYRNPILYADYSDPDVVAVGDDFYMTASSFNCIPGLPILHSKDLVNWKLINHALKNQEPDEFYAKPQHGRGVWAPCIRYHNNEFYIFWGDPDFGIYMVKTPDPKGVWSKPVLVKGGKGLIDPTPLWDDDGRVYMAYAYAASRIGINSVVMMVELDETATRVISNPVIVFDGNDGINHTVEGPKLYKRNGYYYIFAPAGGVEYGWQLAMRSKSAYGPYEPRIVMAKGNTDINGPHQGAWVDTKAGESWFIHFQHQYAYGRIVHLNPMQWIDDWPVIGVDVNGDGCGEPVRTFQKPNVGKVWPIVTPPESDEFNTRHIGLQWQWHANYKPEYGMPSDAGFMRLYANYLSRDFVNFWEVPNLFLQKFPAEEFTATTKVTFTAKEDGDKAGVIVMGWDYSYLSIEKKGDMVLLQQATCIDAENLNPEKVTPIAVFPFDRVYEVGSYNYMIDFYFRVSVGKRGKTRFYYSLDGESFVEAGKEFKARQGKWIGAKIGLFAVKPYNSGNRGWIDVDYFRIHP